MTSPIRPGPFATDTLFPFIGGPVRIVRGGFPPLEHPEYRAATKMTPQDTTIVFYENPSDPIVGSEWMKAWTVIGADTLTDSARVYVIPCPTGDSLVDRESARNLLSTIWPQMNPAAVPANRIERGGYIYDSLGVDITVVSQQDPSDTPCSNMMPKTRTLPVVLGIHGHPFHTNDSLPTQQCNLPPLPQGYYVMGHTWGGPSAGDWVRSYVDQRPHIEMDADSIYLFGPPDPLHAALSPTTG